MSEILGFIHTRGAWPILSLVIIVAILAVALPCLGCCRDKDDAK
jgi:hypothetical protein